MSLIASMFGRAMARAFSAPCGEDGVGEGGVAGETQHLGPNRRELLDCEVGERGLEGRELAAAEALQHVGLGLVVEGGEDADQIVGLRARARPSTSLGSGSGSVLARRIFCAIVSASSVSAI